MAKLRINRENEIKKEISMMFYFLFGKYITHFINVDLSNYSSALKETLKNNYPEVAKANKDHLVRTFEIRIQNEIFEFLYHNKTRNVLNKNGEISVFSINLTSFRSAIYSLYHIFYRTSKTFPNYNGFANHTSVLHFGVYDLYHHNLSLIPPLREFFIHHSLFKTKYTTFVHKAHIKKYKYLNNENNLSKTVFFKAEDEINKNMNIFYENFVENVFKNFVEGLLKLAK